MERLNKKKLDKWYTENIGDFDQEQAEIIEKLIENYNPSIESEDSNESTENILDYMKKELKQKYNEQSKCMNEMKDEMEAVHNLFMYRCDKVIYDIKINEIDMCNKIAEIEDNPDDIITKKPKQPVRPKLVKKLDSESIMAKGISEIVDSGVVLPKKDIQKIIFGNEDVESILGNDQVENIEKVKTLIKNMEESYEKTK